MFNRNALHFYQWEIQTFSLCEILAPWALKGVTVIIYGIYCCQQGNKILIIYCSLPKYAARLEHLSNSVTFPRLLKEELMLQIKLWSKKRRWMGSRKAPGFLLCYMFAVEIICSILMRVDISKNSPCHHFTTSCFSLISCGFFFFFFKVLS